LPRTHVLTTNDDKECGAFVVKVFHRDAQVFRKEYGHYEDGVCGGRTDEEWKDGRAVDFIEGFSPQARVTGEPLRGDGRS